MAKKTIKQKQKYWFWRWIILSVIRFDKLYFLVWGVLVLSMLFCFKADLITVIGALFK
mgnify:CR=1 FL=1